MAEPSLPESISTAPENLLYMLTCKIALPDSPHTIILVKIPDFLHFVSVNGMNSFLRFNTYRNDFFHFWLLPSARKNSVCSKNKPNSFARVRRGLPAPSPLRRFVRVWWNYVVWRVPSSCYHRRHHHHAATAVVVVGLVSVRSDISGPFPDGTTGYSVECSGGSHSSLSSWPFSILCLETLWPLNLSVSSYCYS